MNTVLEIRHARDLAGLLKPQPSVRGISLLAPELDPIEAKRWEARLAHDYSGCGCETGSLFMVGGVLAAGMLVWNVWNDPAWSLMEAVGGAFAILVSAVAAGKISGLLLARRRLRRTVAALLPLLPA